MNEHDISKKEIYALYKELVELLNRIETPQPVIQRKQLKTSEACKYLDCCKNTLDKICLEYNIPVFKICGVKYYRIEDLDNLFSVPQYLERAS